MSNCGQCQLRRWMSLKMLENKYARGVGGHSINQFFRVNAHVVIPELANLTKKSNILNIVEKILGPNLLAWSVELFIKEPGSKKTVSWHQDITYWGMGETDDEVTAWIALTDVSITAGCMRFIPESHKGNIVDHTDTFDEMDLYYREKCLSIMEDVFTLQGQINPSIEGLE